MISVLFFSVGNKLINDQHLIVRNNDEYWVRAHSSLVETNFEINQKTKNTQTI